MAHEKECDVLLSTVIKKGKAGLLYSETSRAVLSDAGLELKNPLLGVCEKILISEGLIEKMRHNDANIATPKGVSFAANGSFIKRRNNNIIKKTGLSIVAAATVAGGVLAIVSIVDSCNPKNKSASPKQVDSAQSYRQDRNPMLPEEKLHKQTDAGIPRKNQTQSENDSLPKQSK